MMATTTVYAKGVVGKAWQYNGDTESMPDWVKSSPHHHTEVKKNGAVIYWADNVHKPVDKGDWFVMVHGGYVVVYSDDAFNLSFTFSDPAWRTEDDLLDLINSGLLQKDELIALLEKTLRQIEDPPAKKYRTKPQPVEAWQYNGNIELAELPEWVIDLILHRNLGYREVENIPEGCIYGPVTAMQFFDGVMWLVVSEGDWLIRYDERTINVVPDEKFKELFEEIK